MEGTLVIIILHKSVLQFEAELEIIRTLRFEVFIWAQPWPVPRLRQLQRPGLELHVRLQVPGQRQV